MDKEIILLKPQEHQKVFISTKIKKIKAWTKEEDVILLRNSDKYGYRHWKKIASALGDRSSIQCSARYKRIRPGIVKGNWVKEEDALVMDLVGEFGKNWSLISKYIPSRTGKQIRDRYLNTLDSNINKDKFSSEEDKKIIELYLQNGTKWSKIAKLFIKRTGDMIKNRFYSTLRKKIHGYVRLKKNSIRKIKTLTKSNNCTSTRAEETNLEIRAIQIVNNEVILNDNEVSENKLFLTKINNNLIIKNEVIKKQKIEALNRFSTHQKETSFTPFKHNHMDQTGGLEKLKNDFQLNTNWMQNPNDFEDSFKLLNKQSAVDFMNDYLLKIKFIENSMNQSLYNYLNFSNQYQIMNSIYNSYMGTYKDL